ncbi:hypothetical protein M9458_045658, partial [Cirrhinus mrigala]
GSGVRTRWAGCILWTTLAEPPRGSGPQWRRCETTSSGSTSAISCREPCSSSTKDSSLG